MDKWPTYDAKERAGDGDDGRRGTHRRSRSRLLFVVHLALFGSLLLCFKSQLLSLLSGIDRLAMTQHRAFDLKVGSVHWEKCADAFDPRLECGYLAYVTEIVAYVCWRIADMLLTEGLRSTTSTQPVDRPTLHSHACPPACQVAKALF